MDMSPFDMDFDGSFSRQNSISTPINFARSPLMMMRQDSMTEEGFGKKSEEFGMQFYKGMSTEITEETRFDNEFEVLSTLGSGHFGAVKKCRNKFDGLEYAVKITHKLKGEARKQEAMQEMFALSALSACDDNPYVVKYFYGWIESSKLFLVMELCRSSLKSVAKKVKRPISEAKIRRIMRDLCLGLQALHKKKIVHLDMKPENILVSNSKKYKIADLGLARLATKLEGDVPEGDCRYLARELLNDDPNEEVPDLTKADIFSFGMMMYEIMRNKALPLNGEEWHDIRNGMPDMSSCLCYSAELRHAIVQMIHPSPSQRPFAGEILDKYLPTPEQLEIRHLKQENLLLRKELEAQKKGKRIRRGSFQQQN